MGRMVSTIKGVRKDAYFETLLNEDSSAEEKLARLRTEVRFAGVLNTCIPRGNLVRKTANPTSGRSRSEVTDDAPTPSETALEQQSEPFDPYALHTTNIYKKEGADGLLNALSSVTDAKHLKSMVVAQRIPVAGLDNMEDISQLRSSIVAAVADRIADRKAAAS